MNWIILFIAGLFEVVMTFCLGKTRGADGAELAWWIAGSLVLQYGISGQGCADVASRHFVCHLDGYWRTRNSPRGHLLFSRACYLPPHFLYLHALQLHSRPQNSFVK